MTFTFPIFYNIYMSILDLINIYTNYTNGLVMRGVNFQ